MREKGYQVNLDFRVTPKNKPAPDNAKVGSYELVTAGGGTKLFVRFFDKDGNPMKTNILYISKDHYKNWSYKEDDEYIRVIAMTNWGGKRIVKKFLKGEIPDSAILEPVAKYKVVSKKDV